MYKVVVTCPPMLRNIDSVRPFFKLHNVELFTPEVVQVLSVEELKNIIPHYDGWIIGDDPATREVFETARAGRLKAAVKWGVGVDNVDFKAAKDLGIPITNTPGMFGKEVADIALGYVIALARDTFFIDREVRAGHWPKPTGISLSGKTAAIVGFGDIGANIAKRLLACDMRLHIYDPFYTPKKGLEAVVPLSFPDQMEEADFLILACALTKQNFHMIDTGIFSKVKHGIRIVNVARGPIIDENALIDALRNGTVDSAALDVFEVEPLPADSPLRKLPRCILGSHNSSNSIDAVERTNMLATKTLFEFLGISSGMQRNDP